MLLKLKLNLTVLVDALLQIGKLLRLQPLTLAARYNQNSNVVTFYFQSKHRLKYRAGQYGIWVLPNLVTVKPVRLFTIASAPESEYIELTTRITDSDFKQKLNRLEIGDRVYLLGPIGRFTLPKDDKLKTVIFIAGGIGITPYHSMLVSAARLRSPINATLIYSAHDNQHLYKSQLAQLATESYFISSQELDDILTAVTDKSTDGSSYYISGRPDFVRDISLKLRKLGIKNVKADGFLGY